MSQPQTRPNVLLILTDQHRLSAVGAYGPTVCRTPNIDRLAADGVRFENAYTCCPVCTPARASLITGQFPHNHGMIQNQEDMGSPVPELPDGPDLLSRRLEAAGYHLGYTGKWHLGSTYTQKLGAPIKPCSPQNVGFEGDNFPGHGDGGWDYPQFRQYLDQRGLKYQPKKWSEPTQTVREESAFRLMEQPIEGTVPYYLTSHTIDLIDRFSNSNLARPFFIWHNFWGPHEPYCPTKEYLDPYRDIQIPPWPNYDWPAMDIPGPHQFTLTPEILPHGKKLTWDDWAMALRYYYAFTTLIDDQVGRLVEHLRQRGLLDQTVIIFAADHGESMGDHGGLFNKGWTHFEETHRIPMIFRMPDGTGRGAVRTQLVSLLDLYPTVLELAGAPYPANQRPPRPATWPFQTAHYPDGESLLPLLRGQEVTWRDAVVSEFHGLYDNSCVMRTMRYGRYKFGYTFLGQDELYDLENDPYEMTNLANDPAHANALKDARARLWAWMHETNDSAATGFHVTRYGRRADAP